jgi:aldose 1-epimerase
VANNRANLLLQPINVSNMTQSIFLSAGTMRCEIVPALGACIAGLWRAGVPVLRSPGGAALASARDSSSYPLVPFSNRVAHATLQWAGTSHPLVKNFGQEPHAIHGVGFARAWQVLEASDSFALLSYEHKPDASWPFAFDTSQAFKLSADTLELTLSITNQSSQSTPVGLGWHPYFVKRASSRIVFDAAGRWEMDAQKLPTHRTLTSGLNQACAMLDVDHCFDGWHGAVTLQDDLFECRVTSSSLSRLVVFTNPGKDFVAVEPVSHVNNAVNLLQRNVATADALGVHVLQPGESLSTEMSIHVKSVP